MPYKCKRLNLNWSLETKEERQKFVSSYLERLTFTPNSSELEMLGNYILWGKSPNGLNGRQEGLDLKTSHGTWDTKEADSLDALLESPTFTESILRAPSEPPLKTVKTVFSRSEARATATPFLLQNLESLWRTIDETELLISFYDLAHSKRTAPIRQTLLNRFSTAELDSLREKSTFLTLHSRNSLRNELVDLYTQQYTLKDSYAPTVLSQPTWQSKEAPPLFWETDIQIKPLCLRRLNSPLTSKLLREDRFPEPTDFTDSELNSISSLLWRTYDPSLPTFDFTDPTHLARLEDSYDSIEDLTETINSNLSDFLSTYNIYIKLSKLKPMYLEILKMKRKHTQNDDIARIVNSKYNHHYTDNYISTLYHKTILTSIAATAKFHREVCENLMFPENFKTCIDCGKTLLKDTENFMRKTKVKDGFDCRCKACAKAKRNKS